MSGDIAGRRGTGAEESVGVRACQAIFDDFRLIQGGESGVWLGLAGCCATCSPMHLGQMSISPTHDAIFGYAENR